MREPFEPLPSGALERATPAILVAFLATVVGVAAIVLAVEFVDQPVVAALAVAGLVFAIAGGLGAIGLALRGPAGPSFVGLLFAIGATLFWGRLAASIWFSASAVGEIGP
jgi:hypothetical protein